MQKTLLVFAVLFLCCLSTLAWSAPAKSKIASPDAPPRLVLTLVIDQFRSESLLRWKNKFRKDGFRRLLDRGAVMPFAQYSVLQCMTCPGHAMILTGSLPARNKIPLNEWFDPETKKNVYCAFDAEFGLSPRQLQGSTVGDQMKLNWPQSKNVALSLKDRSAIMLGGRSADAAYWFDKNSGKWTTTAYYKNASDKINGFQFSSPKADEVVTWKNTLGSRPFERNEKWGSEKAFAAPLTLDQTLQMAKSTIEAHQLGQDEIPDMFALSLSTHDLAGHFFGPDSPEAEDITLHEDRILSELFAYLDKKIPGGMNNVWVLFTADHGVAPLVETATALGLDAGRIDQKAALKDLNQFLKEKFGSCRAGDWVAGFRSFHFYFDPECLVTARFKKIDIDRAAQQKLQSINGVDQVIARVDLESGIYPPPPFDQEVRKSFVPGISGDLIIIPKPFWYELGGVIANHMTSYSYDRTVPLILMGKPFKPGVYAQKSEVIDGAPTLSHVLRITPPALNEGRVIFEALQPEKL